MECEVSIINKKNVDKVKSSLPDERFVVDLASIFRLVGDPTKVRILYSLSKADLCVCDLAAILGMSHSAISHQLRTLRQAKLVKYRKVGKVVYYSLDDHHVIKLMDMAFKHIIECKVDKDG